MCLCTVAREFSFSPLPISSNEGEYPCSATNREMKSYTSRCLRVIAMWTLLANIRRMSRGTSCQLLASYCLERRKSANFFGYSSHSHVSRNSRHKASYQQGRPI